jgi:hypothetical protein
MRFILASVLFGVGCLTTFHALAENVVSNLSAETNIALIGTNAPLVAKTNKSHLLVVSHPDDSTNSTSMSHTGQKESISTRFFSGIKSFFGVDNVIHVFDGKDLDTFYPWLADSGTFTDPDGVFSVDNGMIRISGQHQGFLATKGQFGDYKLVMEFKWGDATWYKHKETPRNSGLFVNATGLDNLDMKSLEIQIAEPGKNEKEGTGDLVLHGGAKFMVGSEYKTKPWETFYHQNKRSADAKAGDWNKMEVLLEGDHIRVTVNGKVTMEGRRATPNSGKILLQSNGAEIFIRRLDVYPVATNNTPALQGQGNTP